MSASVADSREVVPVASAAHLRTFVAVLAAISSVGAAAQLLRGGAMVRPDTDELVFLYLSTAALNSCLVYLVWRGTRTWGTPLSDLVGGRWSRARDVLRDATIAAAFWVSILVAFRVADVVIGPANINDGLLPRSPVETAAWVVASVTAGVCEELAFRGYLQRQLEARAGIVAGVVGQALAFGLVHAYQGMRAVVRIAAIGLMFGALAAWRRTIRPGMLAHAWQDVWEGWLSGHI